MNYRHAFHAGGISDVLKHMALVELLRLVTVKDKPILMMDTHAGAGAYDLAGAAAMRSGEASRGVLRVLAASNSPPAVRRYVDAVWRFDRYCGNRGPGLLHYPGSPRLMKAAARAGDRIVLCEAEAGAVQALRREFAGDRRVEVRAEDGFAVLRAVLPPAQRRALVLIDPPYERAAEWTVAAQAAKDALRRLPTATLMLWHPLKGDGAAAALLTTLAGYAVPKTLSVRLTLGPSQVMARPGRRPPLQGCGLVLINPPWGFEASMREALPWLAQTAVGDGCASEMEWLVAERPAPLRQPGPAARAGPRPASHHPSKPPAAMPSKAPSGMKAKKTR